MTDTKRESEIKVANLLQKALGSDYEVCYDACEGGATLFYYKGVLYTSTANSNMVPSLNVIDYAAPIDLKMALR